MTAISGGIKSLIRRFHDIHLKQHRPHKGGGLLTPPVPFVFIELDSGEPTLNETRAETPYHNACNLVEEGLALLWESQASSFPRSPTDSAARQLIQQPQLPALQPLPWEQGHLRHRESPGRRSGTSFPDRHRTRGTYRESPNANNGW